MFHGANLVPEDLETGEYKIQGTADINDLEPVFITAYSNDYIEIADVAGGTTYNCTLQRKWWCIC